MFGSPGDASIVALSARCETIRTRLQDSGARDPREVVADAVEIIELTALLDRARGDLIATRFATLERIHRSLGRLRGLGGTAQLFPAAARELAACCGFDRVSLLDIDTAKAELTR